MQKMTTDELAAFHDNLLNMLERDGEEAAKGYLGRHLQRLPEAVRHEILGRIFFEEIVNEAREIEAIAKVQEQGLMAIKALEALKKELQMRERKSAA